MTIKEIESRSGLTRSNIRFYEKEGLIRPNRNNQNSYRSYSEQDLEEIKKIAYLRTLGISIEDIRRIKSGELSLQEAVKKQNQILNGQIAEWKHAKKMCMRILEDTDITYNELKIEKYVDKLPEYWGNLANSVVLKLDSLRFMEWWGSKIVWIVIALLSFIIAIVSFASLPLEIPVQWSGRAAVAMADRRYIFVYPIACNIIRFLLRPVLYSKVPIYGYAKSIVIEYLSNFLCFIALSVEVFTILFVHGVVGNIAVLLVVDIIVFIGGLFVARVRYRLV